MKKTTFCLVLLFATLGYSQQQTYNITFEPGTDGSNASLWNVFEGDTTPLEVIANPVSGGINTTPTVAKFTALQTNACYAGAETQHATIGTWFLESGNNSISLMIYKPVISEVRIKFVNSSSGTIFEIPMNNTMINTWELMEFDISSYIASGENHDIDQVVVFPDFTCAGSRTTDNICYFDNITWSANKTADPVLPPSPPASSAPNPTLDPSEVTSIYSNSYTNLTYLYGFGSGNSEVDLDMPSVGNNTIKVNLGFVGAGYPNTDVSSDMFVHFDYWTGNSTSFSFYVISDSPVVDTVKYTIGTDEAIATDTWTSVNIPLSFFSNGGVDLTNVFQYKFDGSGTVYIDNIYYRNSSLGIEDEKISNFILFPNPTKNNWNIKANYEIEKVQLFDISGKMILTVYSNSFDVKIYSDKLSKGLYFAKIDTDNGSSTIKLIKN